MTQIQEEDALVKEKLLAIPALLQNTWLCLVKGDFRIIGEAEAELFCRLEKAGLLEIDESEEHLFLKVRRGEADYKEYKIWDDLQKRYDTERVLLAMTGIYGVVEKNVLYQLFCDLESISGCSEELFNDITEKLSRWEFWNCTTTADGAIYLSFFAVQ